MENITLPQELLSSIGSENIDFAVKAERARPLKLTYPLIFPGIFWTVFTNILFFVFLSPLFFGNGIHAKINDAPIHISLDNLDPLIVPGIFMVIFELAGIGLLSWGMYKILKKGGYFVGTPTRLVHFQNGTIRSMDWELFSGDIEVSWTTHKGDIALQMRTGKMVSMKNAPDTYIFDVIHISAIPNVYHVEQICRRRIKENDPTPATTRNSLT